MATVSRNMMIEITSLVEARDYETLRAKLCDIIAIDTERKNINGTWQNVAGKLVAMIDSGFEKPAFNIFATDGNIKLPYLAFSGLSLASCPGAGKCKDYCYSITGWRNPNAFGRPVSNGLLMNENRDAIAQELNRVLSLPKFKAQQTIDFRLYVDGDFANIEHMSFWFDVLHATPKLAVYGYSKSWEVFQQYAQSGRDFPSNYVLNVSSGSKYEGTSLKDYIMSLTVTRGEFIAVDISKISTRKFSAPAGDYATKEYRDVVRQAYGKKAFVCPGSCGTCTKAKNGPVHACGNKNIRVPVVVGIH